MDNPVSPAGEIGSSNTDARRIRRAVKRSRPYDQPSRRENLDEIARIDGHHQIMVPSTPDMLADFPHLFN